MSISKVIPIIQRHGVKGFGTKIHISLFPNQAIVSGVLTTIQHNTVLYDMLNEWDGVVTYQFTPINAGYYLIHAQGMFGVTPLNTSIYLYIYLNGGVVSEHVIVSHALGAKYMQCTFMDYITPNDVLDIRVAQNSGVNQNLIQGANTTYVQIFRIA